MSIMSLVNLKEDFETLKANPFVVGLFDFAKGKIISYVNHEVITDGAAKKAKVTEEVTDYVNTNVVPATKNGILKTVINYLIPFIPMLVQFIYNQLATFIVGLTATV